MPRTKQQVSNKPRTVRMTLTEAIARPIPPEDFPARHWTDEQIERAAADDPDAPLLTDEQWANAVVIENKVAVSLRLDRAVVEAYRATGKGWQSRINQTLRASLPSADTDPLATLEESVNGAVQRFKLQTSVVLSALQGAPKLAKKQPKKRAR